MAQLLKSFVAILFFYFVSFAEAKSLGEGELKSPENPLAAGVHRWVHGRRVAGKISDITALWVYNKYIKFHTGDVLVWEESFNYGFKEPTDFNFQFEFPGDNFGSKVTFVDVLCTLSQMSSGRMQPIEGGLGLKRIKMLIETFGTEILKCDVKVYAIWFSDCIAFELMSL